MLTISDKSSLFTVIGICIFVFAIFLVAVPTKTITHEVEVVYNDTETYYETEPYIAQESYQELEPYQTTEIYTDTVPVQVSVPYTDYEYSYETYDSEAGTYFSQVPSGCSCSESIMGYNENGDYTELCVQLNCLVATPVTKYRIEIQEEEVQKERPVTKYNTVDKTRNVTKYHEVEKTREVLRTRIEEQPLEVNWLFGYKTPYSLHFPLISG